MKTLPSALLQLRIAVDGDARKRGQEPKAGTALRVLRTFGS